MKRTMVVSLCVFLMAFLSCCQVNPARDTSDTEQPAPSTDNGVSPTEYFDMVTVPPHEDESVSRLVIYVMSQDGYIDFIQSPSKELLSRLNDGTTISIFERSSTTGMIMSTTFFRGEWSTDEIPDGVIRVGYPNELIIYQSLVDFAGNRTNLQEYLTQHGIQDEIKYFSVIYADAFPGAIWVNTESDNYFISIEDSGEYVEDGQTKAHTYRLYTQSDYCDEYARPVWESATVSVDGAMVDLDVAEVSAIYRTAKLPVLALMRTLGAQINESSGVVTILYNGISMVWDIEGDALTTNGYPQNILLCPPGGSGGFVVTDGELILQGDVLQNFLDQFAIVMSCDYSTHTVYITP